MGTAPPRPADLAVRNARRERWSSAGNGGRAALPSRRAATGLAGAVGGGQGAGAGCGGGEPATIVVLMGGSAIMVEGWHDEVAAILMFWYPGMEGGRALADVILGPRQPNGRLPFAVPRDASHLVPFDREATAVTYELFPRAVAAGPGLARGAVPVRVRAFVRERGAGGRSDRACRGRDRRLRDAAKRQRARGDGGHAAVHGVPRVRRAAAAAAAARVCPRLGAGGRFGVVADRGPTGAAGCPPGREVGCGAGAVRRGGGFAGARSGGGGGADIFVVIVYNERTSAH